MGVLYLLFTLMGGGNLAQGNKITAQGEAKSWKLFAEAAPPICGIKCPLILELIVWNGCYYRTILEMWKWS